MNSDDLPPLRSEFSVDTFLRLKHGSRKPSSSPVWVTPKVMTGGFATGQSAASLRHGESNTEWMSTQGFFKLSELLDSGNYLVGVPEHGVLLAVVWLLRRGHDTAARELLDEVHPFLENLRFFPTVLETAASDSNNMQFLQDSCALVDGSQFRVCLQPVAELLLALASSSAASRTGRRVSRRKAHVVFTSQIAPLKARAMQLLEPLQAITSNSEISETWFEDAQQWKATCDQIADSMSSKQRGGTIGRFRAFIEVARAGNADMSVAHHILAEGTARRTKKGFDSARAYLEAAIRSQPHDIDAMRRAVAERVKRTVPRELRSNGLSASQLAEVSRPIVGDNSAFNRTTALPKSVLSTLRRSREDTILQLTREGVIPSAEALALPLEPLQAAALTAGFKDASLRRLMSGLHVAFRQRRSLLLTDFQSQVRIDELPWFAALDRAAVNLNIVDRDVTAVASRSAVAAVLAAWLHGFPGTMMPNKLVSACRELFRTQRTESDPDSEFANASVPLTPELAADIFCDGFSAVFDAAARLAASALRGSLYARYFDLEPAYRTISACSQDADDDAPSQVGTFSLVEIASTMVDRARPPENRNYVVNNARKIEAVMILTSHGQVQSLWDPYVGPLVRGLLDVDAKILAQRAFRSVMHGVFGQLSPSAFRLKLQLTKTTAYAWRQTVFFVSCADAADQQRAIVASLKSMLSESASKCSNRCEIQAAFFDMLDEAIEGKTPSDPRRVPKAWFGWQLPRGNNN